MPYQGPVTAINLASEDQSSDVAEAIKVVDTIAEADDRSGREIAARLIIRAGKDRAERIKQRKAEVRKA